MELAIGKVVGPRVLVIPEEPIDTITARAAEAGLHIVVDQRNKPRPTCGAIIAMGTDPILVDMGLRIGDRITFATSAGDRQFIEGKEYRLLEYQEIKMILPPLTEVKLTETESPR